MQSLRNARLDIAQQLTHAFTSYRAFEPYLAVVDIKRPQKLPLQAAPRHAQVHLQELLGHPQEACGRQVQACMRVDVLRTVSTCIGVSGRGGHRPRENVCRRSHGRLTLVAPG